MNIKKALKLKNKLKSQMDTYGKRLKSENVVLIGQKREYETLETLVKYKQTMEELIQLKAAIQRANVDVYGKIFRLSELKSLINVLRFMQSSKFENSYNELKEYDVAISTKEKDAMIEQLEAEIEQIQEELDQFNGTKEI